MQWILSVMNGFTGSISFFDPLSVQIIISGYHAIYLCEVFMFYSYLKVQLQVRIRSRIPKHPVHAYSSKIALFSQFSGAAPSRDANRTVADNVDPLNSPFKCA